MGSAGGATRGRQRRSKKPARSSEQIVDAVVPASAPRIGYTQEWPGVRVTFGARPFGGRGGPNLGAQAAAPASCSAIWGPI
eukprot:532447-Pyramimonas_sp.AAC.1